MPDVLQPCDYNSVSVRHSEESPVACSPPWLPPSNLGVERGEPGLTEVPRDRGVSDVCEKAKRGRGGRRKGYPAQRGHRTPSTQMERRDFTSFTVVESGDTAYDLRTTLLTSAPLYKSMLDFTQFARQLVKADVHQRRPPRHNPLPPPSISEPTKASFSDVRDPPNGLGRNC